MSERDSCSHLAPDIQGSRKKTRRKECELACEGGGVCSDGETGVVGGGEGGGCDDKRKIQTGQSFPFANRAPDKGSVCSSTDRRAISLLLPFSPSSTLSLSAVSL